MILSKIKKNEMVWNEIIRDEFKKSINEKIKNIIFILNQVPQQQIDLFSGKAGLSIILFYYANFINKDNHAKKALEVISQLFEKTENDFIHHSFAGGLAGIGWVIEHLEQNAYLECKTDEIIGELDEFLYKKMIEDLNKNTYDYLHGASGIALYLLNRKRLPETNKYLAEYVDLLEKIGEEEINKYKWLSNNAIDEKKDVFNLSLSHGISSLIIILSKIYSLDINKDKTFKLLNGAVNYLLANEQDFYNIGSHFPNWISINSNTQKSRLAWCYGDLGIGIALWLTGKN